MELIINKPDLAPGIRRIEFSESKTARDPIPNLRLYCTMFRKAYNLQIRATAPLDSSQNPYGKNKPRNLIATVRLDIDELRQIAEYIKSVDQNNEP